MRHWLIALLVVLPLAAADHYVNSTCTNAGDGTASGCAAAPGGVGAWKTLASVSGHTYAADDFVYFARGGSWDEGLTLGQSGTSGHPITYTAYGTGVLPKINGSLYVWAVNTSQSYITLRYLHMGRRVNFAGGTGNIVEHCQIGPTPSGSTGYGLSQVGGDTLVYQTLIVNTYTNGIVITGTGKVTLRNSILLATGVSESFAYGVSVEAGSELDYDYSLLSGNGRVTTGNVYGAGTKTDGGHNVLDALPGIKQWMNGNIYVSITIDGESHDVAWWHTLAAKLPAGVKISLFVIPSTITEGEKTTLVHLRDVHGWEVNGHSWANCVLDSTTAFTISTTNTGTNTIVVDHDAKTLSLTSTGNPEHNVVVDWNAADKTITDLKAAVAGNLWTVSTVSYAIGDAMRLKALDAHTTTTFPAAVPLNSTYFLNEEVDDTVTWLTTLLGVAPTTMSYPNGVTNATVQTYLKDVSGLLGARGTVGGSITLSSLNVYNVFSLGAITMKGDGSEAALRTGARHVYTMVKSIGGVLTIYLDSTLDMSDDQLLWVIDEWQKLGVTFSSFAEVVAGIRADHSTADGLTYTKTYTDLSDFRPDKCRGPDSDAVQRYLTCYSGVDLGSGYVLGLDPRSATDVQTLSRTLFGWDPGPFTRIKRKAVGN